MSEIELPAVSRCAQTFLTTKEAAQRTGRTEQSLKIDRVRKVGIPFAKVDGRKVGYRPEDVNSYLASRDLKTARAEFDGAFRPVEFLARELRV